MECLINLQQRPKFIDAIEKFQLSGAYPVFFAILCTISGLGSKYVYLPIISVLALSILFSSLFVRDTKVFLAPIIMIYYSLGSDNSHAFIDSNGKVTSSFDTDGFTGICVLAAVIVIPVLIRFIADGSFAYAIKRGGACFYSVLAINVAIILGGSFSEHWTPRSLVYALILIFGLDVFCIIISSIIRRADADIIPYTCRVAVIACLLISAQAIAITVRSLLDGELIIYSKYLDRWVLKRDLLCLSWGVPTIIGATAAVGIPASLYMAKNQRFPLFYYISAVVMWLVSILLNVRSSMVIGGAFLLIGIILISFTGRNKRVNLIFSLVLVVLSVIGCTAVLCILPEGLSVKEIAEEIFKYLRLDSVSDRITIFEIGIRDFLSSPVFGVGWGKGAITDDTPSLNFYSNMYHCVIIQLGASAGILGIFALLLHVKDIGVVALRRIRLDRLILLLAPISILLMSLVDNFIFYLNLQILYIVFFALAQKHYDLTNKKSLDVLL